MVAKGGFEFGRFFEPSTDLRVMSPTGTSDCPTSLSYLFQESIYIVFGSYF